MGRNKRRENKAVTEPVERVEPPVQEPVASGANRLPYYLVFALGFLLYANTVPFDYALDDKLYITANEFTKKGFDGIGEIWTNDLMTGFFGTKKKLVEGGRYRPLALTTHAIEYQMFGKNPQLSHFINIVLYGLCGVILLLVLKRIFGWNEERWWWSLPFVATALYLPHPLHTEVVAKIKSRDEIMSFLFVLLSFNAVLKYLEHRKMQELVLSGIWFFLSLTSKESAVTFLGVIPLTLIFFPKGNLKDSSMALSSIAAFTIAYLAIRLTVFGDQGASLDVAPELMNKPYLQAQGSERLASIFLTMGLYLKLLVWPHPLTHDYYPFHPFKTFEELQVGMRPYADWSDPMTLISVIAYAAILGYGLWTLVRKIKGSKGSLIGYSLLLYFGTFILFSNLIFDIGAFMNERFLFIPSLGYALIVAYLLTEVISSKFGEKLAMSLVVLILVGFSGKTVVRNYAWENDFALASSDIETSDGSAKVRMTMGSELLDQAKDATSPQEKTRLLKEAEQYELSSLKIYPAYFPPLDILGNIYYESENYEYSIHYFEQAVKKKPNDDRILGNLEAVAIKANEVGLYEAAIKGYKTAARFRKGEGRSRIYASVGEVYGKGMNDMVNSKKFLNKAIKHNPQNASAYQKIGIVFAMTGSADSALYSFNKSLELEPENARVMLNLGILYSQMGDAETGNRYMQEAVRLDPSLAPSK